jgi:CRP-like cAMP-binding protein
MPSLLGHILDAMNVISSSSPAVCGKVLRAVYELAGGQQEHVVASSEVASFLGIPVVSVSRVLHELDRQRLIVRIRSGGGEAHYWLTPSGVHQSGGNFPQR